MRKIAISLVLLLAGMTIFAQDMSYYTREFTRTEGSFAERLAILETVQSSGVSGAGEFYHEALKYFLLKTPDIRTIQERTDAIKSASIICTGLGDEKYTAAAPELWLLVNFYDVARNENDGLAMQEALVAMGKVNAADSVSLIISRLDGFNSQTFTNAEARRFAQRGVIGCVSALEAIRDPAGYRSVFFVYAGSYDTAVKNIAADALPNILTDPGDVLSEIIADSSSDPRVKLVAWNEMLKTNAPAESKAKVAATALSTSFSYNTTNRQFQSDLRDLRKGAINAISDFGVADNSVYDNLERTYNASFGSNSTDYDEIQFTLNALSAIKSDEAVRILLKFLQGLHDRRRSGPWGTKERRVFEWVVSSIGATGTQNAEVRMLLTMITRTTNYTTAEQRMATNALNELGVR